MAGFAALPYYPANHCPVESLHTQLQDKNKQPARSINTIFMAIYYRVLQLVYIRRPVTRQHQIQSQFFYARL